MSRAARLLRALAATALLAAPAAAHDGPPYPILVDEPIPGGEVDVWADPDVGVGTFYVYVRPPELVAPGDATLAVRPLDGHSRGSSYDARAAGSRDPYQLLIEAAFDQRGLWSSDFTFATAAGEGLLSVDVDVTPPGLGPFDLVLYASPFLVVGFLWAKAVLTRRRATAALP